MGRRSSIFQTAHQAARTVSLYGVVGSIAVVHVASHHRRHYILVISELANDGTCTIIISVVDGDTLDTQMVDSACHDAEDAYAPAFGDYRDAVAIDDVATAVIVAQESPGMADGLPGVQLHVEGDVALLPEIESPCVAAVVHIVGQAHQSVAIDDEGVGLGAAALREEVAIRLPLAIEVNRALRHGAHVVCGLSLAAAVALRVPVRHIIVVVGQPQLVGRRQVDGDITWRLIDTIADGGRRLLGATETGQHMVCDEVVLISRLCGTCGAGTARRASGFSPAPIFKSIGPRTNPLKFSARTTAIVVSSATT